MFIALFVILLMLVFFVVFIAAAIKSTGDHIKKAKQSEDYGADLSAFTKHVSGLPVPSGVMVSLFCTKEKVIITADAQEISLDVSKLKRIDGVTGKDMQTQANGALAGGLLFGVSGAVIGALASTSTYLVLTYESGGEIKGIILDTISNTGIAKKVANYYKEIVGNKDEKIEL